MRCALWIAAIVAVLALGGAPAAAGPAAADFQVFVTAGSPVEQVIPNGGSANITSLSFKAGTIVDNNGGEEASARVRFTLPEGLAFGADAPDATESCIGTAATAECQTQLTIGTDPSRRSVGWRWDIVAAKSGSYVLRAEVIETSVSDPDVSSNTASATVVVSDAAGGGSGGGGSGGGSAATVTAGAAKVAPAKPRAGSLVIASVRVTAGGAPIRPTAVACGATLGGAKVTGTPRAATGTASCRYRTSKAAKGKTLRGSVAFSARGKRFTKRFSVRLG